MLELNGIYHGKNLYVQNPFSPSASALGFCVNEVRVNGNVATDELSVSTFEIDLTVYGLQPGDAVHVIIYHSDGCMPKVLNPEALSPSK